MTWDDVCAVQHVLTAGEGYLKGWRMMEAKQKAAGKWEVTLWHTTRKIAATIRSFDGFQQFDSLQQDEAAIVRKR